MAALLAFAVVSTLLAGIQNIKTYSKFDRVPDRPRAEARQP
jgi:hypothetical protein